VTTNNVLAAMTLRPPVPMGAYHGLGYVCVLGAVEALRDAGMNVGIGWPFSLVDAGTGATVALMRTSAGYDEGMFARVEVVAEDDFDADRDLLAAGITNRVDRWATEVAAGRAQASPLAPVLSDYFDLVPLLGHPAEAVYPNGNEMARGTFAGLDLWGRAILVTDDGRELSFAPEQASLRPINKQT
jgi:BirA family biotin operon repressor/biotin-[acetyl-CoA-carboxylase] ligase